MQMTSVSSSNVAAVGYDNGILHIRFHNGYTYEYHDVPQDVYNAFMSASSKGHFVHAYLKGRYGDRRIG